MEFSNEGQAFYHRFKGSFLWDSSAQLTHCTGPHRQWIQENWAAIRSGGRIQRLHNAEVTIYQRDTTGVLVSREPGQPKETAFDEFFVGLVLGQADLCAHSPPQTQNPHLDSVTKNIVDLFDSYLRYQGRNDKWAENGRTYFTERVRHFTARNATVEFCLPAFPCKSSNRDKVTSPDPDRGEELALERLHGFVEAIERIYEPGAKLWIISDGHVFSDCIGVDDADVDAYGEKLKAMNRRIGFSRGNPHRVGFKSLVDLFQLACIQSTEGLAGLPRRLNIADIDHHVDTRITEEAELCRRILMAGCGPRKSAVRAKIDSKDPAITALYRGFSRFMLEDLEHHPHTQNMSKSQQKKLSSKVAFEMILRNQAYSNLVEMLFPNHVRLSIHAHNNAGPKFGIQLFDPAKVRAVEALSPDGELMTSLDLLHIPTPWHNCVVELANSDMILVTKAKLAWKALETGSMTGGLAKTASGAAFFSLERRQSDSSFGADSGRTAEAEKDATATVTAPGPEVGVPVIVAVAGNRPRRTTFSEKADAVVTAVVRRTNTGTGVSGPGGASSNHGRNTWLGRLRWLLSLFWPRTA